MTATAERFAFPASSAQRRLWFLDQLEPGSVAYVIAAAVDLDGSLSATALTTSLQTVVDRHESLRTTFAAVDGQPVQLVASYRQHSLALVDLAALPDPPGELRRISRQEARRPFDLARGPLVRSTLLRLGREAHRLILTMHHIVSDAWSLEILVRETAALYGALLDGRPAPLPELPIQYVDFALWQAERLSAEALEPLLAYWRGRLGEAPPPLDLPADGRSSARRSSGAGEATLAIGAASKESLAALGRRRGATPFMVLFAAFAALLRRWTGATDLCIGTPAANRAMAETQPLIGFFVNTLALRCDLSGDPTFEELLARVRVEALSAYAHQDLPFELLVETLAPERSLTDTPLFQAVLSVRSALAIELPGAVARVEELATASAKFLLDLSLIESSADLFSRLTYQSAVFSATTGRRFLTHFQTLLAAAVAEAGRPLSSLPLLSDAEREQVAVEWNDAESPCGPALCLHEIFAARAAAAPAATALVQHDDLLSYGELNRQANRLAHALIALGVGPEVRVGLCFERSLPMVVAILGVLKAGGAYVPLDPGTPRERLAFILDDAAARVVVGERRLLAELPADRAARWLCLEDLAPLAGGGDDGDPAAAVQPDNLAYVIYTSGSTGKPKGSLVSHRNVARLFAATERELAFTAADVWALFHSVAFDFSVWEMWGALLYGGRLVVVPRWISRSPVDFHELLVREAVTVLNQTPSAFRQIAAAIEERNTVPPSLRLVVFGGEALDVATLGPWMSVCGADRPRLVNMYGITETTVHVTWRRLRAGDLADGGASPIGRPLPDLRLFVLGPDGDLMPPGAVGEVYVGGPGLARGYHRRPELTAERFVPDPFAALGSFPARGGRLYRSGDLARFRASGDLEYLGRADQQVKVRGFRIEPGEIEHALASHPEVSEAVVMAREVSPGDRRLVAYYVARPDRSPSAGELREHLRASLPEHMLPALCLPLAALPLTANGKVDRRALPEPEWAAVRSGDESRAPRTPIEELVAAIWCDVLGRQEVGIEQSFFDLGGHSLLATRVVSRIRQACRVELPVRDLFEFPTVAALSSRVAAGRIAHPPPPLAPEQRPAEPPLSFAQERLWLLSQLEPDGAAFNIYGGFRVRGRLDGAALQRGLAEIVSRHESLRTAFPTRRGEPVRVIALTHVNPLPPNLGDVLKRYPRVIVPELNLGQMCRIVRANYLIDAKSVTKVQGLPFTARELEDAIEGALR